MVHLEEIENKMLIVPWDSKRWGGGEGLLFVELK